MTTNREIFDRSIAAWNSGDLSRYLEMYADDVTLHGYSDQPLGRAEVGAFYQGLWAAVGSPQITVHEVAEADGTLWCRATMSGTHAGEMMGISATGNPITQSVMTSLRFVNGKCVERHSVADMLAVMVQIGALPPPG